MVRAISLLDSKNEGRAQLDLSLQLLPVETGIKRIPFHLPLSNSQLSKLKLTSNRWDDIE